MRLLSDAVRFYARAQLRSEWRRRLALIVLLGAVGTVAIGAAAGAVRTSTAVDRFLTKQRAFDVAVTCGPPQLASAQGCEQQLGELDQITDTAPLVLLPGLISKSGRNLEVYDDTCWSAAGDVALVVAPNGRFGTELNIHRFIEGRPADPASADEVVISRELAQRTGVGVGDTINVQLFAGADCQADPKEWQPPRPLTVVGVEISPFEIRPESGDYVAYVHGTPALLEDVGRLPDLELFVAARLRPGSTTDDLLPSLEKMGVPKELARPGAFNSDNLKRSTRPYVVAQWLVSGLTALAGLVLVGQMLSRQIRGEASEFRGLSQLGLSRRDLSAVGVAGVLSVVLPGALLAAVGSILASSFTPLGLARIIEVDRGVRIDVAGLALGTLLMVIGLVCVALPAVSSTARQRVAAAAPPSGRAGALARQMGGGPVSTTGLRMAFEPLRGPTAPPLRTGFGMILAAVTLLVVATLFAGSLSHLLGAKHLIGWNWDTMLYIEGEGEPDSEPISRARFEAAIADTPGVVATTPGTIFPPAGLFLGPDRVQVQTISFAGGPIGPTMISGRQARGTEEIVLGRETLSRLGNDVGDRIPYVALLGEFDDGDPETEATEVPGEVTIVGTAALPSGGGDTRLGTGSAVDFEFFHSLVPDTQPNGVFVRLEPGTRPDELAASVSETLGVDAQALTEEILGPQLLDVGHVRNLPIALAAMLALLAVGVVAQVIVGSTHARRAELGILRALGLRPRQIRGAIVVQALAISGAVLIVGIPLGIAIGRVGWKAFALSVGTRPEVSVATAWLGVLVVSLLVLASLLGLIGSTRPRRQLAAALRRE